MPSVALLPRPLNECGVTGWMFACLKMGACLFVAELASTALAAGWPGMSGLGVWAQAGWVRHVWAGDLVPMALAAGRPGMSGLGGQMQAAGQIGTGVVSGGVAHKN